MNNLKRFRYFWVFWEGGERGLRQRTLACVSGRRQGAFSSVAQVMFVRGSGGARQGRVEEGGKPQTPTLHGKQRGRRGGEKRGDRQMGSMCLHT